MTHDPRRYSTLRRDRPRKTSGHETMDQLYDILIKPASIVVIVGAYFGILNPDLFDDAHRAIKGDQEATAHLWVLLLSLVAGARIIQSLYLAKRDYSRLDNSLLDAPIFLLVVIFTSGGLLKIENITVELSIYTALAFAGTLNFFYLYHKRIPRSDDFDYPIERKIQAFNAAAFLGLTGLTALAAHASYRDDFQRLGWAIATSCVLLVANIVHSQHLTMLPKFLLHNEPDSVANSIKAFRETFGHLVALKKEEEIQRALFAGAPLDFRPIKTVRATTADVDLICTEILRSFPYIFNYIFGRNDRKLRAMMRDLLLVAGGFGALGYMSFYFIVNDEGERVGLFKIDTAHGNWIYRAVEVVRVPFLLVANLRTLKIVGVWQRAKRALADQSPPQKNELRLTYLILPPRYRQQGYGKSFLRLMQNALLHNNTNGILADCITLFVREKNLAARGLFERAGFSSPKPAPLHDADPFIKVKGVGRAILMEKRLS